MIVFSRLSMLTKLEDLNLSTRFFDTDYDRIDVNQTVHPQRCLELTLDRGLDSLKSLVRLSRLQGLHCEEAEWDVDEARWAVWYWTRLDNLSGIKVDPDAKVYLKRFVDLEECRCYHVPVPTQQQQDEEEEEDIDNEMQEDTNNEIQEDVFIEEDEEDEACSWSRSFNCSDNWLWS